MNESLKRIYRKYNGRALIDDGGAVPREYGAYQRALERAMTEMAAEINAQVVNFCKGRCHESVVFHRNGRYAYLVHRSSDRTTVNFNNNGTRKDWIARAMAGAGDWSKGTDVSDFDFETLPSTINRLLNT